MQFIRRKLKQGLSLEDRKKLERPAFTPPPLEEPAKHAFLCVRHTFRVKGWRGYLVREGFRWSRGNRQYVYDQHDDGSRLSLEEAEWIAERVREMVSGDIDVMVGTGIYVEPIPDLPPVVRHARR